MTHAQPTLKCNILHRYVNWLVFKTFHRNSASFCVDLKNKDTMSTEMVQTNDLVLKLHIVG